MNPTTALENHSRHQQVFLLTIIGLLILRIPFFAGIRFFNIQWEWMDTIYQIGTYLLTTFLIWWELDNLTEFHIDTLAVMIIILFKPVQTLMLTLMRFRIPERFQELYDFHPYLLLAFPSILSLMIWLIAIILAIGIWRKRSHLSGIKLRNIGWLFIGMAAGLLTMIVLSYPMSFQLVNGANNETLSGVPFRFFYQIGYAAISEEPLFRGFLWGYLRKLKWREVWIWLFQAGLFTFSHIYYINTLPISFWIVIPVISLVLGFLAWRSRTIASSIAAHAMMNGSGNVLGYLMYLYRTG